MRRATATFLSLSTTGAIAIPILESMYVYQCLFRALEFGVIIYRFEVVTTSFGTLNGSSAAKWAAVAIYSDPDEAHIYTEDDGKYMDRPMSLIPLEFIGVLLYL